MRLLGRGGGQGQLDFTQTGHRVLNDDRIVVLEVYRDVRAEARALGKEDKMLEEEVALYNFRMRLGDRHTLAN